MTRYIPRCMKVVQIQQGMTLMLLGCMKKQGRPCCNVTVMITGSIMITLVRYNSEGPAVKVWFEVL